jgi:hypothetical protein
MLQDLMHSFRALKKRRGLRKTPLLILILGGARVMLIARRTIQTYNRDLTCAFSHICGVSG